jgi:origin recognition complex subunit 5
MNYAISLLCFSLSMPNQYMRVEVSFQKGVHLFILIRLSPLAKRTETSKLFKLAQPYFASASDKLYLRDISSAEWSAVAQTSSPTHLNTDFESAGDLELPYYSKYLLIASFLASYNPSSMDTRYFARDSDATDRRKRRKGDSATTAKVS